MSEPNSPELEPHSEQTDGRPRAALNDFGAVDWQAAVAGVPFRRLYEYGGRFSDLAKQASAAGNAREAAVYQSLADVCWLVLREDSPEDPFAPFMVSQAFRTGGIEDLSSETVAACSAFAPQVNDPKLRARLADVAWVRARDYQAGKLAVASYLVLAEPIEPARWPEQLPSLERALAIALQLGRGNEELGQVARFIEDLIRRYHATDEGLLCAKLLGLLSAFAGVDAAEFAHLAESLARRALSAKDFHQSREYWSLAADWASRAKNPDQRRFFLQQLGESYVSEAEESLGRPVIGPLLAAGHLQRAIVSLREAGGPRARVDELRARLVSIQPAAVASIPTISHKVDITEHVLQAEQSVAGKALPESLLALVRGAPERAEHDKKRVEWVTPLSPAAMHQLRELQRKLGSVSGCMFPSKRHPSGHIPGDLLGEWLRNAERQAKLPKLAGGLWHPYRRGWASERMHFPLKAVADARGWKDVATLVRCYQQTDQRTLLAVMANEPSGRVRRNASRAIAS